MDKKFIEIVNNFLQIELTSQNVEENLKELGLDSMASIELLLEIETEYELAFPDELLTEETFSSAKNLWNIVSNLREKSSTF